MEQNVDTGGAVEGAHERLAPLERSIGYRFADRSLLHSATIHRSFANETEEDIADNEVLEFLGDAVLGLVVSELLYRRNPELSEGEMSKLKAFLVSSDSLARRAEEIDLGTYLVLGKGEEKTDGRLKDSLLANSFEAVIAAVYLDGGLGAATRFIDAVVYRHLDDAVEESATLSDFKSLLQERLQSTGRPLPVYTIVEENGPDHDKTFHVVVEVDGEPVGEGQGKTKKAAEQEAARRTVEILGLE
ncbi:MAG: ribonuclease III [Acidobacteriota bacterium]|jgi:ribonuclease-3